MSSSSDMDPVPSSPNSVRRSSSAINPWDTLHERNPVVSPLEASTGKPEENSNPWDSEEKASAAHAKVASRPASPVEPANDNATQPSTSDASLAEEMQAWSEKASPAVNSRVASMVSALNAAGAKIEHPHSNRPSVASLRTPLRSIVDSSGGNRSTSSLLSSASLHRSSKVPHTNPEDAQLPSSTDIPVDTPQTPSMSPPARPTEVGQWSFKKLNGDSAQMPVAFPSKDSLTAQRKMSISSSRRSSLASQRHPIEIEHRSSPKMTVASVRSPSALESVSTRTPPSISSRKSSVAPASHPTQVDATATSTYSSRRPSIEPPMPTQHHHSLSTLAPSRRESAGPATTASSRRSSMASTTRAASGQVPPASAFPLRKPVPSSSGASAQVPAESPRTDASSSRRSSTVIDRKPAPGEHQPGSTASSRTPSVVPVGRPRLGEIAPIVSPQPRRPLPSSVYSREDIPSPSASSSRRPSMIQTNNLTVDRLPPVSLPRSRQPAASSASNVPDVSSTISNTTIQGPDNEQDPVPPVPSAQKTGSSIVIDGVLHPAHRAHNPQEQEQKSPNHDPSLIIDGSIHPAYRNPEPAILTTTHRDCRTYNTMCSDCRESVKHIDLSIPERYLQYLPTTHPVAYTLTFTGTPSQAAEFIPSLEGRLARTFSERVLVHAAVRRAAQDGHRAGHWYDMTTRNPEPRTNKNKNHNRNNRSQGKQEMISDLLSQVFFWHWAEHGEKRRESEVKARSKVRELTLLVDFPSGFAQGGDIERCILRWFPPGFGVRRVEHFWDHPCLNRLRWWERTHPRVGQRGVRNRVAEER
ncbi:hypothetical protein BJX61DRAFT_546736 [Aspergillus egyptiacus]|nr:hypothetical protein BJX61DRAFT_546736 [Aspergillus egyptiacus]